MSEADELYDKGIDLFSEGHYDEAIDAYRQALEVDPNFVDALHGLAMAQAEKGDVKGAIESAHRIIELTPEDPLGYTSLSMFYQRNGQIQEAESASAQARMLEWKRELKEDDSESS